MTSIHHVHNPENVYEEPTPEVDRIQVTRVVFRRGVGCCDQSPVRMVTVYFDPEGRKLAEMDPSEPETPWKPTPMTPQYLHDGRDGEKA